MGCSNTKVPSDVVAERTPKYDPVVKPQEMSENALPLHEELHADLSEIQELSHQLKELNDQLKLLVSEKYGVQRTVDIVQAKLLDLTTEQTNSKNKYQNLLTRVVEKDAEELYRGLNSANVDKRILIEVLTARPRWHITLIAETYEREYNVPLFLQIREKVTSQFGKLIGSKTGLSKLLEYMTTDQPERDGNFLQSSIHDIDLLLEVGIVSFVFRHGVCRLYSQGRIINFIRRLIIMKLKAGNIFLTELKAISPLQHLLSYQKYAHVDAMRLGFH